MQEIERKFLVQGDQWRTDQPRTLRQGYLCLDPERTVRVRLDDGAGTLTIKGKSCGAARAEFEYPIPADDAQHLLDTLCLRPLIEKHRHVVQHADKRWEIDEFFGDNEGLVVAEIELSDEQEAFDKPDWAGEEVTSDARYFNANLIRHPYREWRAELRDQATRAPHATDVQVTYLQLTQDRCEDLPPPPDVTVERCRSLTTEAYLQLYNGVGKPWGWVDRNAMDRAELQTLIDSPRVWIHRLRVQGKTAGFSELDGRDPQQIQLAYFGLFPDYLGRGLGPWFLNRTLQFAWSQQPQRIWLHTCTGDHPAALRTYQNAGFEVFQPDSRT